MSQDQRRPAPGSADPDLAQRVEALVDEAVGQAAKGSYAEAAARAQQALTIDPDHAAARDLLDSYRQLAAHDDERRRRRRSIAAAAAAIEEMIEAGQLEEATTGTEALTLQYGQEAPVAELQARIAEARAGDLDFAELDAAIAAIRQPDATAARAGQPAARLDAMGTLVAEIEDHLRSGRLDEASGRLVQLEEMPGSEDRLHKLRQRIEDARHVAADDRREEEILIATAAIEERLRRGNIDDAAARLADLDARHGANAPVAELRQQIQDARAEAAARAAAQPRAAEPIASDRTAELLGVEGDLAGAAVGSTDDDLVPARSRARWLAIAAVVALVAGGGWWLYQRQAFGPSDVAAGTPAAIVDPAPDSPADARLAEPAAAGIDSQAGGAGPTGAGQAVPLPPNAAAIDSAGAATAGAAARPNGGAVEPAAAEAGPAEGRTAETTAASGAASSAVAPADPGSAPGASTTTGDGTQPPLPAASSARPEAPSAPDAGDPATLPVESSPASAAASDDAASSAGDTDVVVEAVPVTQAPPPVEAVPPAIDPAPSDDRSAGAEAAASDAPASEPEAAPAADTRSAAAEEAAAGNAPAVPATAAARPAGPVILGCGAPDVVCVKSLQVPTPAYPAQARARRLSANVVVMALVDERGRVIESRLEDESFPFFNQAALDAANRSVFQPASRAGVPGRSWVRLTFRFDPR